MAPYTYSRNRKPIVEVAIGGFVLATSSYVLYVVAAQGCHFLHSVAWVAFQALRPAISTAWQSAPAHLCEASGLLPHLLQIVTSIQPMLCVIAG